MKKILLILCMALPTWFVLGQSPGGVGTPVVWLKAEQGITTSGTTVNGWANAGSSGGVAGQLGRTSTTTWALPEFSVNVHNFNPAVVDNSSTNDESLLLPDVFPTTAHRALSSFVLYSNSNVAQENNMISYTPLKLTSGALEAPYMGSSGNNNLWFYWEGIYQTNPALPNGIVRFNNIPSVNAFYVPQWVNTSTAHKASMSMNGATTIYSGSGLVNAASRPFGNQLFIFGDGNNNNGNAGGKVSEIITYDRDLTSVEKQKISSYLSVKYGISLTTDNGTGVPNYLNSSGSPVWNSATNSGYNNNIAGIANDTGSALNQKQSKSVNTGLEQVIIGTTGFADNNSANTTSLTSGQYLLWGDNGLARRFSQNITGLSQVTARFAAVWKVQNTGGVGQVRIAWPKNNGLHVIVSNDATFATGNTATAMSNVQTINGVEYNYADITINDGQYFTFGKYFYAPGGVIGESVWLRADKDVTVAAGKVDTWVNQGISEGNAIPAFPATGKPNFISSAHNFNPVVMDNTTAHDGLVLANVFADTQQRALSSFVVQSQPDVSQQRTMISYGNNIVPSSATDDPWFTNQTASSLNVFWQSRDGNAIQNYPNSLTRYNNIQTINSYFIPKYVGASNTTMSNMIGMNGSRTNFNRVSNANIAMGNHLFVHQDGGTNNTSEGSISEVISYDKELSTDEQQRIDSYLAIKYGITLYNAVGNSIQNYLNSTSNVIWDGTNNSAYYNNIAGIGREDISTLHQKQSKSVNENQKLIIGAGNSLFESNALNTNSLTSGQFLIVGDNGLRQGLSIPLAYTAGTNGVTNYRFESVWKVQNTGTVGNVTVAWPKGVKNLYLVQSPNATFVSGNTFTPMTTEVTVSGVVYNTATVTLGDGQFFTFAGYGHAPGGVATSLSYWYRADADAANTGAATDVTSWKDVWNGNVVAQMGTNTLPKYVNGAANYFNFNPGLNFTSATNQSIGNVSSRTVTGLDYDIFTFTKEGLAGPGNSRVFSSLADITKQSGDIAYWDGVGLNLNPERIERVNYATTLRYLGNPGGVAYSATIPSIMYNQFRGRVAAKGLNGALENSTGGTAAFDIGLINGGHLFGDPQFSGNGSDNRGFTGHLGETIIYGAGNITATERRRVDSYLAIKYGITMGRVNTDHYLDADGNMVWNGGTNTSYNNNVFGVAREDIGLFEQKVSKSVNAGTILTLATTNDFVNPNLNASRTGFTTDKTYFLLGDNNNVTTTPVDVTVGTNTYKRIQRVWMAQEKDADAGSLFFEADLTAYNSGTFVTTSGKMIMLVADDAAFTTNVIKVNPTSNALAKWVFNQNVADGKFITFAADPCYGPDTDGDGVADMCDQDNDNDGILNTNEGYICGKASIPASVLTTDHVMNYNFVDYNGIKGFNFKLTSTAVAQRWASPVAQFDMSGIDPRVTNNKVTYEFDMPVDNLKFWVGDLDAQEKVDVNFYDQNGTRITNLLPYTTVKAEAVAGSTTFTTDATYGVKISTTRFSGANSNVNYVEISTPGIQISKVEATFVGTNGNTPEYHIANMCAKRDLDGDRIPDYLDLDSDGDGCPDAIEGTGHFTSANLVSSSLPGGNSGAGYTGTSSSPVSQNLGTTVDANGIPVIANGGQGIGYSQSAYVNACIDTDNDGKPDIIDLDNDNDGITNLIENCGGYYAQNVSGAWKGNTASNLTVTAPSTTLQTAPGFNDNLNNFYVDTNGATQRIFKSHVNNSISLTYNFSPGVPANELAFYIEDVDGLSNGAASATYSLKINGGDVNGWMIKDMTTNYMASLASAVMNYDPVTGAISSIGSVNDQWLLLRGVGNNLVTSVTLTSNNFGAGDAIGYSLFGSKICDTDGDGIPNYLDLDSDGDGCPDAIEGAGGFITTNLVTSSMPGGNSGAGYTGTAGPVTQNLGNTVGNTATTFGIPTIAGTGQAIGSSANASVSNCTPPFCYKPGIMVGTALDTKVGITALSRAGADNSDNWPMVRKGGWLALESKTKGFVPNKVAFSGGNPVGIAPADFVEGMMVYDDTNKCMKMYTQKEGEPSMAWHCITTQTCPD